MSAKLKFLIQIKKYETLQEVIDRLNSFNMWGQITPQEYNELMAFAKTTYQTDEEEPIIEDAATLEEPPILEEE